MKDGPNHASSSSQSEGVYHMGKEQRSGRGHESTRRERSSDRGWKNSSYPRLTRPTDVYGETEIDSTAGHRLQRSTHHYDNVSMNLDSERPIIIDTIQGNVHVGPSEGESFPRRNGPIVDSLVRESRYAVWHRPEGMPLKSELLVTDSRVEVSVKSQVLSEC